jgi:site-specific DNA-cytosine methylase
MGTPADSINTSDLEDRYRPALLKHLQDAGAQRITVRWGKIAGDLRKTSLRDLEVPVDLLVAGPPCPPWSGQSSRKGFKDDRAAVCVRIVEWVYLFVKCAGLLGCVLENIVGITHETDGVESAMSKFLRVLQPFLPEFAWSVDILSATDYLLPHTRTRVFLKDLREIIATFWASETLRLRG